ncbi:radical SAM protein [Thermoleptolyngbya sp. M55_K2018_002]|uniref:radical SAM protein n=1 Tax=Thermoleptolyngbya sp. M55_K2018_002 TaxID=2747808 RepID=UPI001A0E1AD8|nr:radical SAM protein [Thermoleptolyngbya sp. M55_K2018_002]HIK40400.1 radical SAM protein [Thermoleptolyngbya sp. M55_K2018_002]
MSQQLTAYYGEFLISPIPLELSVIEPCSMGCLYCFAVLGDRHHAAKSGKSKARNGSKQAVNLLADYQNRNTLEAQLLRDGYPVLISNRTDPFSLSNRTAAIPIMRLMTELEIPIAFQTKGFSRPDDMPEVLEFLKPSCWYISIAFNDDDLRAKIELGAPSLGDRLRLIETLREHGHSVVVGINPCVPEWLPRPLELVRQIKAAGAEGAWVQCLHLSSSQEKQLKPRERESLTQALIDRAKKKQYDPADLECFKTVRSLCQENGLEVYSSGQGCRSGFWEIYRRHYPKTFPTMQDFINLCHDEGLEKGAIVTFDDFHELMSPFLPEGELSVGHYLGATAHNVIRDIPNWTNRFTYDALLAMIWDEPRYKLSPARCEALSYALAEGEDGNALIVDENGMPCMAFNPEPCGWGDLYEAIAMIEELPELSALEAG